MCSGITILSINKVYIWTEGILCLLSIILNSVLITGVNLLVVPDDPEFLDFLLGVTNCFNTITWLMNLSNAEAKGPLTKFSEKVTSFLEQLIHHRHFIARLDLTCSQKFNDYKIYENSEIQL